MPKFKKRVVKLDDATRLVIQCFLNALEKNQIKDSKLIVEKSKTNGLWSLLTSLFPEGIQGVAIELLKAKEYVLHEIEFKIDATAEILHEEYNDFWVNVLKQNGIVSEDIVATKIRNHNVLIYQLLLRMCADALSVNMMEGHDGLILINTMHTFIHNIKEHEQLLVTKRVLQTSVLSQVAICLATDHEIWMTWMSEMVSVVKTIHANIQTIQNLRGYLKQMQTILRKQLLAELATQEKVKKIEREHFHDDLLNKHLRDLEQQSIDLANGVKPLASADRARHGRTLAMQRASGLSLTSTSQSFPEHASSVIASIDESAKSALADGEKIDVVSGLYALLSDTEILFDIVARLETLDTTMGWIAIMTGVVKLEAIANLFRDYAKRCTNGLKISPNARIFKSHHSIALALISGDATSANRLASLGIAVATQLQELQNPNYLKRIGTFIKNALESLLEIQSQLGGNIELVDRKICARLIDGFVVAEEPKIESTESTNAVGLPIADSEASRELMTDLPTIPGLVYQPVPGDGHCLFHAVGLYLNKDQQTLRHIATDYIRDNWAEFRVFVTLRNGETKESYLQLLRTNEWADHLVIEALMQALQRPILVIGREGGLLNQADLKRYSGEPIFVYYNGINHYDVFLRAPNYNTPQILAHFAMPSAKRPHTQKSLQLLVYSSEIAYLKRKKTKERDFIHLYPKDEAKDKWRFVYWKKGRRLGIFREKKGTISGERIISQQLKSGVSLDDKIKQFMIDFILHPEKRPELMSRSLNSGDAICESERTERSADDNFVSRKPIASTQSILSSLVADPSRASETELVGREQADATPAAQHRISEANSAVERSRAQAISAVEIHAFKAAVVNMTESLAKDLVSFVGLDPSAAQTYVSSLIAVIRKNKLDAFYADPELFGIPASLKPNLLQGLNIYADILSAMRFTDEAKRVEVALSRHSIDELRKVFDLPNYSSAM